MLVFTRLLITDHSRVILRPPPGPALWKQQVLHHEGGPCHDPGVLVGPLVEPLHVHAPGLVDLPQQPLHVPGKAPAAVVALDPGCRHMVGRQLLRRLRLGLLHGGVRHQHIQDVPLALVYAGHNGHQVVGACVRRVRVADDLAKCRLALLVPGNVRIGAEAGVQLPLDVHRLLLVVRVRDLRAGQPPLFLIAFERQKGRAEHGPPALVQAGPPAEHKPVVSVLALQQTAAQVLRAPPGHDKDLHPALLDTGEEGVRVPAPLLIQHPVVEGLLVVLDGVVNNAHGAADAGDGAAEACGQVVEELPLQAPQLRRRVPLLDPCAGKHIVKDGYLAVQLVRVDPVPHIPGEPPGQDIVVRHRDHPRLVPPPHAPLHEQCQGIGLPVPGRQVDHQVPVCLASLGIDQPPLEDALQGVAQVPLVGPVIPVELRVHQFAVFVEGRLGGQDAAVHDALRIEQFLQLR